MEQVVVTAMLLRPVLCLWILISNVFRSLPAELGIWHLYFKSNSEFLNDLAKYFRKACNHFFPAAYILVS